MSKKVVLDLEAIQSCRPSTVNPMLLPQASQDPLSTDSQPPPSAIYPHNHTSLLFKRHEILDLNAYASFKQTMIVQPTWGQTFKGWILMIVAILLMSLGLLAIKLLDGNPVVVAMQISTIFAVVNFGHHMFCFQNNNEEDKSLDLKSLFQASILKVIRSLLTAFLVRSVYLSYVSLLLGYSSHLTLFILMVRCQFDSYKILFMVVVAMAVPISLNFNFIYTFLGILMTGAYLRLENIKQKPLHSGITWLICGAVMFVIMILTGMQFQLVSYSRTLLAFVLVALSSKMGKQYLLGKSRQNYMKEEIIKSVVKLIPIIFFLIYQSDTNFFLLLLLGVIGTIMSEYKTELEDTEDMIIFT